VSRPPRNPQNQPAPEPRDPVPSKGAVPPKGAMPPAGSGSRPPRPLGVVVIAAVVALEALELAAAALWLGIGSFSQPPQSLASSVFLVVLTLALAAGLAAVSVNAYRGFRWTRSAAFVWQLLMVALAMPALFGGAVPVGVLLLLPALAGIYYLFTPRVVAFSLRTGGEHPVL
jgi:hypothetical protein